MIKAILFDLDGTLLPMDQDEFTKAYFGALSKELSKYGYEPKALIDGVWQGTKAMVKNDGKQTNKDAFWNKFAEVFGEKSKSDVDKFDSFYETHFDEIKIHCGYIEEASKTIEALKKMDYTLVLASNPIFPVVAQKKRMQWAGLNPDDFAMITSYENSHYCKPNPLYFKEIIEKLGLQPSECLMVGNDTTEDDAAKVIGIDLFLVTKCLINKAQKDINNYPHGDFTQLLSYIDTSNK